MKSRTLHLVRRDESYRLAPGGAAAGDRPEDAIDLHVVGPEDIPTPDGDLTEQGLRDWLRTLRARGFAFSALDGAGNPVAVELSDGD